MSRFFMVHCVDGESGKSTEGEDVIGEGRGKR